MSRYNNDDLGPVEIDHDRPATLDRPEPRRMLAGLVITTTVALALGVTLRCPSQLEANDISRWCTVWSLLERGTYAIDDCPWQGRTQDKVLKSDKIAAPGPDAGALKRLEYAIAPSSWKDGDPVEKFYSSKPPLLPTIIAGILYPFREATGVPLDREVTEQRNPRYVEKEIDGVKQRVLDTPTEPVRWSSHVFYFNPIIVLLNLVPLLLGLILYGRILDRESENDWAWYFPLFAAAFGTMLGAFHQTLNNHTVAASAVFFTLCGFLRIWDGRGESRPLYAATGFAGAFAACMELPAALFGILLFLFLFARRPARTLLWFVPGAVIPVLAFLATQYAAFGQFMPVYEEFGTKSYLYETSYWSQPLEFDYLNKAPESYGTYLFHMTLGHHGIWSLTPVFVFSIVGALRALGREGGMRPVAVMSLLLTAVMLAFYTWNPKARNYGGSTQGLRWLFWLIPFWLMTLPLGVAGGQSRRWLRGLCLVALAVSVFSVGYALRHPWSHPWVLDMIEHLGLYSLRR
jgi:hypothetical protein